ncbi:integrase core domain-containing protein [Mycobacterium sp. MS1601]|uniref:integrase core domain-containing protein n=1 Tax=Mycobacterium sp. MS1601 TaxID=1936029 RepID=UPI003FA606C2
MESFNDRVRRKCLNRNHWYTLLKARAVIGDFKDEHNLRHRDSAPRCRTPADYAAVCRRTHTQMAYKHQLNLDRQTRRTLAPYALSNGDSQAG